MPPSDGFRSELYKKWISDLIKQIPEIQNDSEIEPTEIPDSEEKE
jgi:hypothetical protein